MPVFGFSAGRKTPEDFFGRADMNAVAAFQGRED